MHPPRRPLITAALALIVGPGLGGCLTDPAAEEADDHPDLSAVERSGPGADHFIPPAPSADCPATGDLRFHATIDASGGELALCGARVVFAAGQVDPDIEIEVVLVRRELGYFEIQVSEPVAGNVWLELPTGNAAYSGLQLFRVAGDRWIAEPTCLDHGGVIGQHVAVPGKFAAHRPDPVSSPMLPHGSAGWVSFTGADPSDDPYFDPYADGTIEAGHAVTLADGRGIRRVMFTGRKDLDGPRPAFARLNLGLDIAADGTAKLYEYQYLVGYENYYVDEFECWSLTGNFATVTLDPATGGDRYAGSYKLPCTNSEGTPFDVEGRFDLTTVADPNLPLTSCDASRPPTLEPARERVNLAFQRPATQIHEDDYAPARDAVDGWMDTGARVSGSPGHWQVDLGRMTSIGEVVWYLEWDPWGRVDVLVSADGAAWRPVGSVERGGTRNSLVISAFARFVRIVGVRAQGLNEVQVFAPNPNLASGKPTTQSSTHSFGDAANAVDGNRDGWWSLRSVTHTELETGAWWQVDLGGPTHLGTIVVHNRTDCCADRLTDFDVLVSRDGVSWTKAASHGGPAATRTELSLLAEGRYVRVQLRGRGYLSLAEVELFEPVNLAEGRPARQSSDEYDAWRANDGNARSGSGFARTGEEAAPWWQVDLQQVTTLGQIVVFKGEPSSLADFDVLTSTDGVSWSPRIVQHGSAANREAFVLGGEGRYVRIQRRTPGRLSLAEVQIFAAQNVALGKRAAQSSTLSDCVASRAVDGNTDGDRDNSSVTHTGPGLPSTWGVDLGPDAHLGAIVLHNRTDCCSERLRDVELRVSSDGVSWQRIAAPPGPLGERTTIPADVTGRFLQVSVQGYLSLAEVEVFPMTIPTTMEPR